MILHTYRHKKLYQYLNLDKVVVNTVVKKGLLMYEFMLFTENRKQMKNYFIMREKKVPFIQKQTRCKNIRRSECTNDYGRMTNTYGDFCRRPR